MKKILLSIFAVLFAFAGVQAQEVAYTLTPKTGSNNSYAGNCDIEIDGIKWNLTGNSQQIPWRMGGKSLTKVDRALYSKTAMDYAVDKVVLSLGTMSSITVNSAKLLVADNASFTNATETSFTAKASTDVEIPVTAAAGSYYKFVFNVTVSGTSNKFIQISKAVFYKAAGSAAVTAKPTFSPSSCTFEENLEVTISAEDGATIYYTVDGTEPTTESNEYAEALTIEETTTVNAIAVLDGITSSVATAEYTKLEAKTIEEVIEAGVGTAYTTGTVVATYNSGFLMSDETGSILVYQGKANIGDVVKVKGTTSKYAGLLQFSAGSTVENIGTTEVTYPEATVMDGVAMDAYLAAPYVKYVEYTGVLTISNDYYNVAIEGATKAQGSISYPAAGLVTAKSGETVKVTGYTIGVSSSKYVNTMAVKVEVVEDGHVELPAVSVVDGAEIELGTEITITPAAKNTVTYSVNGADAVEITGETIITADVLGEMALDVTSTYDGQTLTATYTFVVVPVVVKETATLTFDNTSKRTEFSTSKQVWTENGVTFTNVKGSSTTSVAEYANPVRCYKSSDITITSEQKFNKIIFDCVIENSSKDYATPLKETIGSNVTISDDIVTVEFDEPVSTFTIKTLKGQVRIDELTVVYAVEEVPSYTLSVTAAGYATLFLDFNAAIPAGVEAYAVTAVNTGYVTLKQVEGVLPANTGVIVKAKAGEYTFEVTGDVEAVDSKLLGSLANQYVYEEAYVLGYVNIANENEPENMQVGLYKAKMTDGKWLNNANKAYLPASAVPTNVKSLSFRFGEGTTGIEQITDNREQSTVIYDLTGRRVEEITAPGIYVVNGKKVLVK